MKKRRIILSLDQEEMMYTTAHNLADILKQLPKDAELVGISNNFSCLRNEFCFESESFKEIEEGMDIPKVFVPDFFSDEIPKLDLNLVLEKKEKSNTDLYRNPFLSRFEEAIYTMPNQEDKPMYFTYDYEANQAIYENNTNCIHSWKQYIGFTSTYEYCEHCDIKK